MTNNQKLIESILNFKHEDGSFPNKDSFEVGFTMANAFYIIGAEKTSAIIETVRLLLIHGESIEDASLIAHTLINSVYPEISIKDASLLTGLSTDEIKKMILDDLLEFNKGHLKRDQITSLAIEKCISGNTKKKPNINL